MAAAPLLRKLYVEFDDTGWIRQATDLEYVAGDYTWEYLEEVRFGMMIAKEEQLLDFVRRHKGTLKRMNLNGLVLRWGGSWDRFLAGITQVVKWEKVSLFGGSVVVVGEGAVLKFSLDNSPRSSVVMAMLAGR